MPTVPFFYKRSDDLGNLCTVPPFAGAPFQFFLTTSGDGKGIYNQNIDYSAISTDIYYEATSKYDIYTLLVVIADNANFNQTDYGAITAGGIVNGVKFFVKPAGQPEIPLLSGIGFKYNYEYVMMTEHVTLSTWAGTPQILSINFNIFEDYGKPINMQAGDRFIARLNDNFTGLISHTFGLRGIKF